MAAGIERQLGLVGRRGIFADRGFVGSRQAAEQDCREPGQLEKGLARPNPQLKYVHRITPLSGVMPCRAPPDPALEFARWPAEPKE